MAWMLEQEPVQEPGDSHSDTRLSEDRSRARNDPCNRKRVKILKSKYSELR